MKNFKYIKPDVRSDKVFATVEVPCGFLWLKTKTVKIFKESGDIHWRYVETGKFTPGDVVETLEKAYNAKQCFKFP